MNYVDPVMQALWLAKDANASQFSSASQYIAHLRSIAKRKHPAGRKPVEIDRTHVVAPTITVTTN